MDAYNFPVIVLKIPCSSLGISLFSRGNFPCETAGKSRESPIKKAFRALGTDALQGNLPIIREIFPVSRQSDFDAYDPRRHADRAILRGAIPVLSHARQRPGT
jgi:hypothetical protein